MLERIDLRANSAIITIFGDAVLPRGGNIWLGSLITLAAPLGIAERLVRTGVYRLSNEGWLTSKTRGRRAYYSLTDAGFEKFHEAQRRIYASEPVPWDGQWRLVQLLAEVSQSERQALRRELGWLGFGQISPTLLAHPIEEAASTVERTLQRLEIADKTLVFQARLEEFVSPAALSSAVSAAWRLSELDADYGRFIATFQPVADELQRSPDNLSDQDAFLLRIVLIHDYRRVLLKDPVLPDILLPPDWHGGKARQLCERIYKLIAAAADRHLVTHFETFSGEIPDLSDAYKKRFGGIAA